MKRVLQVRILTAPTAAAYGSLKPEKCSVCCLLMMMVIAVNILLGSRRGRRMLSWRCNSYATWILTRAQAEMFRDYFRTPSVTGHCSQVAADAGILVNFSLLVPASETAFDIGLAKDATHNSEPDCGASSAVVAAFKSDLALCDNVEIHEYAARGAVLTLAVVWPRAMLSEMQV
jgi:hypothetical protein